MFNIKIRLKNKSWTEVVDMLNELYGEYFIDQRDYEFALYSYLDTLEKEDVLDIKNNLSRINYAYRFVCHYTNLYLTDAQVGEYYLDVENDEKIQIVEIRSSVIFYKICVDGDVMYNHKTIGAFNKALDEEKIVKL